MMVGFMAYMLNIAPPRNRPTYIGFMNTLLMPVSFAPVLGGILAPHIGYRWLVRHLNRHLYRRLPHRYRFARDYA